MSAPTRRPAQQPVAYMHTCFALNVGPDASVHDEVLDVYPNADEKTLELLECMALTFLALHGVTRIQELGRTEMIELFDNFAAIISTTVSFTRPHAGLSSRTKGLCGFLLCTPYPPPSPPPPDTRCPISFGQAEVQVVSLAAASGVGIDGEIGDDTRSQAPTDENVPSTKPMSETHIRAGKALTKMKETKLVRKKVAKRGGCTAEESVTLNKLRLDATMENRIRLEVWKDKVKDQASLGRLDDDLVFIFAAMAGNTIDDDDDLEAERRRLMKEAHRFA